jgi:hypothetical protein
VVGKRSAWLVSLPVMLAGCLGAHLAAYVLVEPGAHARHDLLANSGHGYLSQLPLLGAAVLVLLLAAALHHALVGRAGARPRPAVFVALPPLAFTVQEHLERWAHAGGFPVAAALEPTFLLGLALQLPFALLAWLLARATLGTAEALGRLLRPRHRNPRWRSLGVSAPASASLRSLRPLALGAPRRGPPPRPRPAL